MEWVFSLDNINKVAKEFWLACRVESRDIERNPVIAFDGLMASGKTTFIHALCDVLGVQDAVGSPTFSIINEYVYGPEGSKKTIFHIDLYRLKDTDEAIRAGVEDVLNSGHICLVEWPEKARPLFPRETIHASVEIIDDKTRRLKITKI